MSRRKILKSALAHKAVANDLLDNLFAMQTQFNALVTKINADTTAAFDVDYVSTIGTVASLDTTKTYGEMYRVLASKLVQKKLGRKADDIMYAYTSLAANMNSLMAKLDAEAGTLNDVDYASTLSVSVLDMDTVFTTEANHCVPRKEMIAKLANKKLANEWIDAIITLQTTFNALLSLLDLHVITPFIAAVIASFTGQVAGMTTDVTIDAVTAGLAGNITLVADSITDIDGLILAWNTANPTNTVILSAGDGSQIPTADIILIGGADAILAVSAELVSPLNPDL